MSLSKAMSDADEDEDEGSGHKRRHMVYNQHDLKEKEKESIDSYI